MTNGKDCQIATFMDGVVNSQLFMALDYHMKPEKVMDWHWDDRLLRMSTCCAKLEQMADVVRQWKDTTKVKTRRRKKKDPQLLAIEVLSSPASPASRDTSEDTQASPA